MGLTRKTWYSILGVDAMPLSLKNLLLNPRIRAQKGRVHWRRVGWRQFFYLWMDLQSENLSQIWSGKTLLDQKLKIVSHQQTLGLKPSVAKHKNLWLALTLESVIDVGQGISVGPGRFGKKNNRRALNKRRAWKIWQKNVQTYVGKKIILCANCIVGPRKKSKN